MPSWLFVVIVYWIICILLNFLYSLIVIRDALKRFGSIDKYEMYEIFEMFFLYAFITCPIYTTMIIISFFSNETTPF